jgi:hypothetical protein
MRVFVHCDNTYRNFNKIESVLKQFDIDSDYEEDTQQKLNKIVFFYGFNYSKFNKIVSKMNINIQRRNYTEINSCLSYADIVILFHNFIEYNNGIKSMINACVEFNKPVYIYTDRIKNGFLIPKGEDLVLSKNMMLEENHNNVTVKEYNFKPYNNKPFIIKEKVKEMIRASYLEINNNRESNKVILI